MKLRAFGHLGLAEFNSILEPCFVSFLTGHERAKVANLKRLREVLIVVQRLETFGFEVRELEVETLSAGEVDPNELWEFLAGRGTDWQCPPQMR